MTFVSSTYKLKEEKSIWNANTIGYVLYGIILLILLIGYLFEELDNKYGFMVIISCFLMTIVLKLRVFGTEKVTSKHLGYLEMNSDGIKYLNRQHNVKDITELSIKILDFENDVKHRSNLDNRGMYSEGVNNLLEFTTSTNEQFAVNFKLNNKDHKRDLKEFVLSSMANNLLTLNEAISIIGLDNYREIQNFKNEVTTHNKGG